MTGLCCVVNRLCCAVSGLCCAVTGLCCVVTGLCCAVNGLCCEVTGLCYVLTVCQMCLEVFIKVIHAVIFVNFYSCVCRRGEDSLEDTHFAVMKTIL